ncbi:MULTISPECIES: heavy metal translocating P-type ATPase [Dialister]|uniref:heavy metal translocating P-type ATPase n=1 Tax=Dialister TaxID=39948 RepID=UPI001DBADDE8|nr:MULTISPECIES: heavy metal translocating P-type ATPase [Dialister]MBS1305056.1 cadmium-translocating P-type ATPase [Dialister sp.]MBS5029829.1 cadmium-translocating P-type ATPase [Dialister invisus]MBS6714496.1 cadmium-translocating P-type ATPase [Dialister sp.]
MNKKQKRNLIRIIVAAILMIVLHFAPVSGMVRFGLYLVPYLIIGYDILWKAFKGVKNRQPFDESLLMAIATLGAIILAVYEDGDYTEAIGVMLFYQIGEWFQSYAVGKSRRNISELMDIRPDYANVERENGQLEAVDPDEVEVGTIIVVKPGEKIPIDGEVVEGSSTLNTSALTGESLPREVESGDEVISGCININGLLKIRTTKEFGESTVSKILDLVENASSRKSKAEDFISKFARVYTPTVVAAAIALALVPPFVRMGFMGVPADWDVWIYRALTFLVISCPCALVISIPLSFFAGIGGASKAGVLVKGSNYLETLSKVKTVVFDKTGTLTKGVFQVTAAHPQEMSEKELLHLAAHVERYSTHPIAASLRAAYPNESDSCRVEAVEEIAGQGIRAHVNGNVVCVGNSKMMEAVGAEWYDCHRHAAGTVIHVSINGRYAGHVIISDVVKETSKAAIAALKSVGVARTVMLTGDAKEVADAVAKELGIDQVRSELLPADKVQNVEELLLENKGNGNLAFVGDGINDAPVLTRADIGIAMGAMGSDAAIEAADVVLMDDDPMKISQAIRISRKCLSIVNQNTWFSIGIKLVVLLLGAVGIANMWFAIFADVGVMILAVLNAMRALFAGRTA